MSLFYVTLMLLSITALAVVVLLFPKEEKYKEELSKEEKRKRDRKKNRQEWAHKYYAGKWGKDNGYKKWRGWKAASDTTAPPSSSTTASDSTASKTCNAGDASTSEYVGRIKIQGDQWVCPAGYQDTNCENARGCRKDKPVKPQDCNPQSSTYTSDQCPETNADGTPAGTVTG